MKKETFEFKVIITQKIVKDYLPIRSAKDEEENIKDSLLSEWGYPDNVVIGVILLDKKVEEV